MVTVLMLALAAVTLQDVAGDVNLVTTALLGLGSSLILGCAKLVGGKVAQGLGGIDAKIVNVIKPVQPLVLMGLTWALPVLAAKVGIAQPPDAATVAAAPLAALFGITARELVRRVINPRTPA